MKCDVRTLYLKETPTFHRIVGALNTGPPKLLLLNPVSILTEKEILVKTPQPETFSTIWAQVMFSPCQDCVQYKY